MPFPTRKAALAVAAALCLAFPLALAACGGGGGGGAPAKTAMQPDPPPGEQPDPMRTPNPASETYAAVSPSLAPLDALRRLVGNENSIKIESPPIERYNSGPFPDDDDYIPRSGSGTLYGTELPTGSDNEELNRNNLAQHRIHGLFAFALDAGSRAGEIGSSLYSLFGISSDDINENFEDAENIFKRDYNLSETKSNWANISTAETAEICYEADVNAGALCGANLEERLSVRLGSDGERLPPRGNEIDLFQYRNSEVAYLEYSAFFLNRIFEIRGWGRRYIPWRIGEVIPSDGWPSLHSHSYYTAGFAGMAASVGQVTLGSASPPPIGTWEGGMLGVKYPLSPLSEGGVDHDAQSCGRSGPSGVGGCTFSEAMAIRDELSRLTGDVTFTLMIATPYIEKPSGRGVGDGQYPFSISFSNISDQGGNNQEGWTWTGGIDYDDQGEAGKLIPVDLIGHHDDDAGVGFGAADTKGAVGGAFYGPNFEEVGGTFVRQPNPNEEITGAFGAKRQ